MSNEYYTKREVQEIVTKAVFDANKKLQWIKLRNGIIAGGAMYAGFRIIDGIAAWKQKKEQNNYYQN